MNKRLLSQVLDGATFPAVMLAVAVSPINFGSSPERANLNEGKRLATEVQVSERVKQQPKEAQEQ
jgi:hypothetical protein